jgi:hypothetical protein
MRVRCLPGISPNLDPRELSQGCISSLPAADISRVPDPTSDFAHEGWFDRYDKRLREVTGYRLEKLPAACCPPKDPNQLWIATISEDGPADHSHSRKRKRRRAIVATTGQLTRTRSRWLA